MRGAAMSLTAAVGGSIVLLLTMTVVQGKNDWRVTYTPTQICALKGSTVEMSCTYTYPTRIYGRDIKVEETFWFTKWSNNVYVDLRTDPEYSGRVQNICDNNKCTLRITDLRESDSAEYKFRFITNHPSGKYSGSPGVTLSVADLQVQVNTTDKSYNQAELTCQSSCLLSGHPHYVWYKNEEKIQGQTSKSCSVFFDPADRYSCAVEGYEKSRSPPVSVKDHWDVTYTSTQICAFKQSTVDMSCTYRYPARMDDRKTKVKEKFWFTKAGDNNFYNNLTTDSEYSGRVQYICENNKCTLRITNLRESDAAEYKFRFTTNHPEGKYSGSPGVTLSVTDPQFHIHVRRSSVNQYVNWTELTCHTTCQLPDHSSYIWYNNGQKLEGQDRGKKYFHPNTINPADKYSCAVYGLGSFTSLQVYLPRLPSVSVSPTAEIVENSSVTLTCSSDANPAANYTWYKKNGDPEPQPLSKEAELVFRSIQSSDSGEYYCTAENELGRRTSESISVNVKYPPRLPSVSVSPSAEIVEGSSVTLTCSSDANPAAEYTWYKEKQKVFQGPQGHYNFMSISPEDTGNYTCKSENQYGKNSSSVLFIDVQYPPRLPSVSGSPSAEIVEGSSVTLTCSSDAHPAAEYTWYKKNEDSPKASGQIFTITDITPEHSGNYYCEAHNGRGRHNSTLHLTVVAVFPLAWTSAAIGTTLAVFLAVICLTVFLRIRKKKTAKQSAEPEERPDNAEQPVEQDDLNYASIRFSHNQTDPVYYNIRQAGPRRQREEEEEEVEYTDINFKSAGATPRTRSPDPEEDPATLYSTVNNRIECKRNF